jgi:hypothetical protein
MKQLLRTGVTAAVGAIVAVALVVGSPAIAGQIAAKNSVTSKSIKNGTIKQKDLRTAIRASLAKADSSLQTVAAGSLTYDFGNVAAAGQCGISSAIETGVVLDDAIILVEGPWNVVGAIHMQGRPLAAGSTQFQILACNTGGAFNPPEETYTWAVVVG